MIAQSPSLILVVDRSPDVGRPIVEQLAADGYRTRLACTAEHARALARAQPPDAVLLGELALAPTAPERPNGPLQLLAEIRACSPAKVSAKDSLAPGGAGAAADTASWPAAAPVIVMSRNTRQPDLLRAFEAGADDFLTRPPSYLELRARLRALLTRSYERHTRNVAVGPLQIDLDAHVVWLHGRPVQLRRLEYELLLHLAHEPRRVCTKQELLRAVWGHPVPIGTRTLDSHASRLRRKLGASGGAPWVINVRGVGYRLV